MAMLLLNIKMFSLRGAMLHEKSYFKIKDDEFNKLLIKTVFSIFYLHAYNCL